MENVYGLLFLVSSLLLVIGLFSPNTSLFWLKQNRTRGKSALIYGCAFIAFTFLFSTTDYAKSEEVKQKNSMKPNPDGQVANESVGTPAQKPPTENETRQADAIAEAETKKQAEEAAKEVANQTVSGRQLISAYQANEVKADQDFKGRTFYVKGTITEIKKDLADRIYVTLDEPEMALAGVQCYLDDEQIAASLNKGQKVVIKGTCDGLMMYVQMKNCELIK